MRFIGSLSMEISDICRATDLLHVQGNVLSILPDLTDICESLFLANLT